MSPLAQNPHPNFKNVFFILHYLKIFGSGSGASYLKLLGLQAPTPHP